MLSFKSVQVRILEAQNTALEGHAAFLQERIRFLESELIRMKREGFAWAPGPADAPEPAPALPERVMAAIHQRSAPGSMDAADMIAWAQQMSDAGLDEEWIMGKILEGASVDV